MGVRDEIVEVEVEESQELIVLANGGAVVSGGLYGIEAGVGFSDAVILPDMGVNDTIEFRLFSGSLEDHPVRFTLPVSETLNGESGWLDWAFVGAATLTLFKVGVASWGYSLGSLTTETIFSEPALTRAELDTLIANGSDITNANVSQITDFSSLFAFNDTNAQDLSNWDTSSVTTMYRTFYGSNATTRDLSMWDASAVVDKTEFNLYGDAIIAPWPATRAELIDIIASDLSVINVDVSEITDFTGVFQNKTTFNENISGWNMSSAIILDSMFNGADAFNQPLPWNTVNVTSMRHTFNSADSFNQPLPWNTSNVVDMYATFANSPVYDKDLSGWNVDSVTNHAYFSNGLLIEPIWSDEV